MPYHKFSKSLTQSFSCGMRFKIRNETEDSSERRLVFVYGSIISYTYCIKKTNFILADAVD